MFECFLFFVFYVDDADGRPGARCGQPAGTRNIGVACTQKYKSIWPYNICHVYIYTRKHIIRPLYYIIHTHAHKRTIMLFWTGKRDNYYIIVRHCIVIKTSKTEQNTLKTLHTYFYCYTERKKKSYNNISIPFRFVGSCTHKHAHSETRTCDHVGHDLQWWQSESFEVETKLIFFRVCRTGRILWTKNTIIVHRQINNHTPWQGWTVCSFGNYTCSSWKIIKSCEKCRWNFEGRKRRAARSLKATTLPTDLRFESSAFVYKVIYYYFTFSISFNYPFKSLYWLWYKFSRGSAPKFS